MTDLIPDGFYLRDGEPHTTWHWLLNVMLMNDRPIRIIARVCDSNTCLELALYRTFWPDPDPRGQTKCARCTAKLRAAARAMGFDLQAAELPLPVEFARDDSELRFSLMELH